MEYTGYGWTGRDTTHVQRRVSSFCDHQSIWTVLSQLETCPISSVRDHPDAGDQHRPCFNAYSSDHSSAKLDWPTTERRSFTEWVIDLLSKRIDRRFLFSSPDVIDRIDAEDFTSLGHYCLQRCLQTGQSLAHGSRSEKSEQPAMINRSVSVLYLENYQEQRVHDNQMIAKLFAVTSHFGLLMMKIDEILLVFVRQFILECVLYCFFHPQVHSSVACKYFAARMNVTGSSPIVSF